jgi:hypothetical protein
MGPRGSLNAVATREILAPAGNRTMRCKVYAVLDRLSTGSAGSNPVRNEDEFLCVVLCKEAK